MRDQMKPENGSGNSDQQGIEEPKERPGRRLLLDFGPLLLFFATNYFSGDLNLAIKVLIGTTLVALLIGWIVERRLSIMAAVGCAAVAFFGGLSIIFDNELFIKIKPTIVTLLLAALITGGRIFGRNPLRAIMGGQITLTETGWRQMSWLWVAMFVSTALANEIAWRLLSTDDWITFKVFGITGISLVFMVLTYPVLLRHQIEK